jgi:hypothetical protein
MPAVAGAADAGAGAAAAAGAGAAAAGGVLLKQSSMVSCFFLLAQPNRLPKL